MSWRMNTQACVNVYIHMRLREYLQTVVMEVSLIDEVSWRMNEQACVNVYIHMRVKRVLTDCSDGGIVDRRGIMENEHTDTCQSTYT